MPAPRCSKSTPANDSSIPRDPLDRYHHRTAVVGRAAPDPGTWPARNSFAIKILLSNRSRVLAWLSAARGLDLPPQGDTYPPPPVIFSDSTDCVNQRLSERCRAPQTRPTREATPCIPRFGPSSPPCWRALGSPSQSQAADRGAHPRRPGGGLSLERAATAAPSRRGDTRLRGPGNPDSAGRPASS